MRVERERLFALLKKDAYQFRAEGFTLKSGRQSYHYFDCRPVLMHAEAGDLAARLMRDAIERRMPQFPRTEVIAGVVLGSVPLVDEMVAQEYSETTHFWLKAYVRPEPKEHGTKKRVEMDFALRNRLQPIVVANVGKPRAVLVEDVWTTGGSSRAAKEALEELGIEVGGIFALVDREEEGTERPDYALFKMTEFTR